MKRLLDVGDYVYYYDKDGNTVPTMVLGAYPKTKRIRIVNFMGKEVTVLMSKCELQKGKP